jgi:hypothetical protein
MLTKTKMLLAAALVLGSAATGFAQGVVPEYDGDANPIPGQYDVLPGTQSSIERSYAGPVRHYQAPTYYYGANGPAWERNFERWLNQD